MRDLLICTLAFPLTHYSKNYTVCTGDLWRPMQVLCMLLQCLCIHISELCLYWLRLLVFDFFFFFGIHQYSLTFTFFLLSPLWGCLTSDGRNLMLTLHLVLKVPSSLTYCMPAGGSLCLFPCVAGGRFYSLVYFLIFSEYLAQNILNVYSLICVSVSVCVHMHAKCLISNF